MPRLPLSIAIAALCIPAAFAQPAEAPRRAQAADAILLTIFLHHDQAKSLDEIQKIEETQAMYKSFPPPGTAVVSWYVVMGIGQIVTLEVPAARLRDVNLAIEKTAWKAFRTEFFPAYDYYPVVRDKLANKARLAL